MLSSYFVVPLENLNHAPTPSIVLVIPGLASASDKDNSTFHHPPWVRTHLEEFHPTRFSRSHPGQTWTAHGRIPKREGSHVQ